MVPRQDTEENLIEEHQILLSTDGENWSEVSYGTWWPDQAQKLSAFQPQKANYVRLSAAASNGIAIADLQIYETEFIPPNPALGAWGPTIDLPLVPVSGAVDPISGAVVTWSSWGHDIFTGSPGGDTQTATWHPRDHSVSQRDVENTQHDMFCPGISTDQNGKIVVTGGTDQGRTSIYNTTVDRWFKAAAMNIERGYQATSTLSDGRIFVIGGSFSGGVGGADEGGKDGEVYDPVTNQWTQTPGADVSKMLTDDILNYRQDNHGWLFAWTNGTVFQAGPSKAMNWYGTSGNGTTNSAGSRTGDEDAMCGNAVMYDNGKILAFGGAPWYENKPATTNAAIITIDQPDTNPSVEKAGNGMLYKRTFHSSVVLPDGSVFVNGGQDVGLPFNESGSHLTPERFIPDANGGKWIEQQKNSVVRVYHSLSLLLQDGTVFTGGGGLCGDCDANHFDGQIYTPPYLLNEDGTLKTDRPVIKSVSPNEVKPGDTVEVTTDGDVDEGASIIRYGSSTHTVNTDQRRIGVKLTKDGSNKYKFQIPAEAGIAQPGYYMLFVLKNGVPSQSVNVRVAV
jgi:galactose oxidase